METPKKAVKWGAEADRDLFAACLVVVGEPKGQTLSKAVELLRDTHGVSYTTKAASHRIQHLQKLKRKDGAPAAANETPTKKATAKKRTAAKVPAGEDDSDGEPDSPPKKKRAVGKKKAAAVPAAEEDKEEEEDVKASIKFEADRESSQGI